MPPTSPQRDNPGAAVAKRFNVAWLPVHKVIVHHRDHPPVRTVAAAIVSAVPGCNRFRALRLAMTARFTGAAIVYRAEWDEAEICAGLLRAAGVRASVEPDA